MERENTHNYLGLNFIKMQLICSSDFIPEHCFYLAFYYVKADLVKRFVICSRPDVSQMQRRVLATPNHSDSQKHHPENQKAASKCIL